MKQIPNSKYFIDDLGNVYGKSKKLKTNQLHNGYRDVTIRFLDSSVKRILVHRLVALVYLPNPENKPVVNHKDGDKANNRLENLEWASYKENNHHARANGYLSDEEGTAYSAVYTKEQIVRVCELLSEGRRDIDISKITDIPISTIYAIRAGKNWTHISEKYVFSKKSRKRKVSDSTIEWICKQLVDGLSVTEIVEICDKVTKQDVYKIKSKQLYTDISSNYF